MKNNNFGAYITIAVILFSLLIGTLFVKCSRVLPREKEQNTLGSSVSTIVLDDMASLKRSDFNLFCKKENISSDIKNWHTYSYKDFETGERQVILMYIVNDTILNLSKYYINVLDIKQIPTYGSDTTFNIVKRLTYFKPYDKQQ